MTPIELRAGTIRAELARRARADINTFMEFCFDAPNGSTSYQGWMHRQWHRLADIHQRLLIVAPRGHRKTEEMAVGRTMWTLGNDPENLIKLLCQSDKKAVKRLTAIRDHLRHNDRLHMVFPNLKMVRGLEWNKHMITVPRRTKMPDPSIEAIGITSSASGDRATLIVADDVVDRRNAITLPKVRDQIREAWDDWVNLLMHDGRIIYICTLWSNKDLTHDLINNPAWAIAWYEIKKDLGSLVKLPDGTVWEGETTLWGRDPSCPIHGEIESIADCRCGPWTREALEKRRLELGPRRFARGFSNKPMADDEVRILPSWIRYWRYGPEDWWPRIVALDTASTTNSGSDYTGIVVIAVNPEGGRMKIEEAQHSRLSFPERIKIVQDYYTRYEPDYVLIEIASGGRELAEHIISTTSIPVRGIRTRGRRKIDRLDQVTPLLNVIEFAPHLDPERGIVNNERGDLVGELLSFPIGAHEDLLDAWVHGVRFASIAYPGFVPDEEEDDNEIDSFIEHESRVMLF